MTTPPPPPPAGAPKVNNGKALASMIVGIVSVAVCCYWFISLPGGVVAIVLGILGRKEIAEGNGTNGGMALTGIITGAVAAAIALGLLALTLFADGTSSIEWCVDNPDSWLCQGQ